MRRLAIGVASLIAAGAAQAHDHIPTQLTVFGGYATMESGAFDGDGVHYSIATKIALPVGLFVNLSYDGNETEDDDLRADLDFDEIRAGLGYQRRLPYDMRLGVDLNYARAEARSAGQNSDGSGVAMNVNFSAALASNTDFYARVGYVNYDSTEIKLSGPDLQAGLGIALTGNLRLLFDYRLLRLSKGESELDLSNIRMGLRFDI